MTIRSPQLLGRRGDLTALADAVEAAWKGTGPALVLLLGEAGIGKSRLVAALADAVGPDGSGVVTCRGTAVPGGAATPLLPWADALRQAVAGYGPEAAARAAGPALSRLSALLPDLDPAAGPVEDGPAADLLPWYVGRLAAGGPLLVVLDDVHLADVATLTTLSRVVEQAPPGLAVVATARPAGGLDEDPAPWTTASVRLRRLARTMELRALDDADAAELVGHLAVAGDLALDAVTAADIVERAQGNPFFLEELVAVRVAGRGTVPPAEVLGVRLDALGPAALAVAESIGVHGTGVPHGVLRELAQLDELSLLEGLRELVAAGLVVEDEVSGGYGFRHVLVGDAVRERMLPVERRRLHAACARSIQAALGGAGPARRRRLLGQLPHHWAEAGDVERALSAAVLAAEASAAVDPDVAAAHYARALELEARLAEAPGQEGRASSTRAQLLERLAEQRGAAGEAEAATLAARAALELVADDSDPARQARLHRLVAVHGEGVLTDAEVLASYDAAVEAAERLGDSAELAATLAARARHDLEQDHNARAVELARRAREIAQSVGADAEEALAAATLGSSLCYLGGFDEGLETLAFAVPALEEARRPYDAARALLTLVWGQFHSGDVPAARVAAERAALALRDGGGPRDIAVRLEAAALEMQVDSGRWEDLDEQLGTLDPAGGLDPAAEVGTVEVALLRSVRAELALRRGDLDVAAAAYGAVLDHWDRLGLRTYDAASLARLAEIASARGDVAAAREYVDGGLTAVESADTWVSVLGYARAGLAVEAAAARAGRPVDTSRAERLRALLDRGTGGAPKGSVAAAELATAVAEASRVFGREDPDAWGAAVDAWAVLGFPWWRAASLLRCAEATVARRGARQEAAAMVADVLGAADLLGARSLVDAAHDLVRRAGLDLPAAAYVDGATPDGSESAATASAPVADADPLGPLSTREREVVMLLASGSSNRRIAEQLFISEKTASVHVSHILAKLGVSSRLEAAAVVHGALSLRPQQS